MNLPDMFVSYGLTQPMASLETFEDYISNRKNSVISWSFG